MLIFLIGLLNLRNPLWFRWIFWVNILLLTFFVFAFIVINFIMLFIDWSFFRSNSAIIRCLVNHLFGLSNTNAERLSKWSCNFGFFLFKINSFNFAGSFIIENVFIKSQMLEVGFLSIWHNFVGLCKINV